MNGFKKNQIVVYAIVLMLVVAGYLNYIERDNSVEISAKTQNTNIGDATLVSNNEIQDEQDNEIFEKKDNSEAEKFSQSEDANEKDKINESKETNSNKETNEENKLNTKDNPDESIETNAEIKQDKTKLDEYFTNSKIEREKMYSQMLETYQKILANATISEEQKAIATNEIKKINDTKNAIMICENLIEIKGFSEVVVLANGESVNAVIKSTELSQEQIAQIQNIITREMNTAIENIHIMKK